MSSSISNTPSSQGIWSSIGAYAIPPCAASAAIIPVFPDMIAKSAQQKGLPIPSTTFIEGVKKGVKAAPTVGVVVGVQMIIQNTVENALVRDSNQQSLSSMFVSSAVVGIGSAPILAVFNGQTIGKGARESLRNFSFKQGFAIAAQETAFVIGLSAADRVAVATRKKFGDNKFVDYTAAFIAGAAGSLAGHPANTALTRWQEGMAVENWRQLTWGAARKARAMGCFAVLYKLGKEHLSSPFKTSQK